MPVPYFGDFAEDDTVNIPFNTFDSNDPSASVTIGELADGDIHVHKDAHIDEIETDGATIVIDFDGITGNHMINIDTSVDAAYTTGSEYQVRIEGTTVDGATVNGWVGTFSIERAGGVLASIKAGTIKVDLETIKTKAITCGAAVTVRADVGAAAAPGAANGMFIGGTNAATTVASLSVTGQLDAGNVLVDGTTVLTGNTTITGTTTFTGAVSLSSTLGIAGAATLASLSVTGQMDAGNLLIDSTVAVGTTTTLSGDVSCGAAFDVVGALTAGSVSIDGGFDIVGAFSANSVLVDTTATVSGAVLVTGTTTHTGAVTNAGGLVSDITGSITGDLSGAVGTCTAATVSAIGANVITAASIAAAAIDNATFAADVGTTAHATNVISLAARKGLDDFAPATKAEMDTAHGLLATEAKQDIIDTNVDQIETAVITNAAGVDVAADIIAVKAETATILTDTDELQVDDIPGKLAAIDTLIDGIKAVTDALTAAAATKLALSAGTIMTGTVSHDNTAASTTVFYCDDITEATADHLNGRQVIFTSGALQYQASSISDYEVAAGEGKFTVVALTEAPADNVTFIIV